MKKKSFIWYTLLIVLIIAVAGGFYAYKEFNRKAKSMSEEQAAFRLTQAELLNEFSANEKAATEKFADKVLEVTGVVKLVDTDDKGFATVVLGDSGSLSSVRCSIDSTQTQTTASLQPNTKITIKGICTGYNADELGLGSDVILNRCVLLKS
ncbi:hypothetical protein ESA94_19315 [Lacibacter luteus]|uniref:tRNA_anti-like n=1 Tax=Lacibacter luteus TaxID=2508719 RepID=A0A4Q1CEG1_9BACT|nr:hypothetical protein [Lacibacter luteus]RXK58161.1 hypothetical protein ESA94_19315 [Lacibacter luteus]